MKPDRKHHRFSCEIDVDILSTSLEVYPSIACDISKGGVFLIIPISSVVGMERDGIHLKNGETIQIALPNHDLSSVYFFTCHVKHHTVVKGVEIMVGLQFSEKDLGARDFMDDLLSHIS